jgi:hypothetical protein
VECSEVGARQVHESLATEHRQHMHDEHALDAAAVALRPPAPLQDREVVGHRLRDCLRRSLAVGRGGGARVTPNAGRGLGLQRLLTGLRQVRGVEIHAAKATPIGPPAEGEGDPPARSDPSREAR